MPRAVIVAAARTPMGSFQGALAKVPAPQLGAVAIRAALARGRDAEGQTRAIDPELVDAVFMGCVLPAGQGQAPARQAALKAGLPQKVPCVTINKVCGSGLWTVVMAAQQVLLGDARCVVAGGMENMSQSPYLLSKARDGYRMGHGELTDSMIKDGLWDPYSDFHMGVAGELCASEHSIGRERQDAFATESYRRANAATAAGAFAAEIAPVEVPQRRGPALVVDTDEEPGRGKPEKFGRLRPAFKRDGGTITAANASSINDGAAAVVVMSEELAAELGLTPLATIGTYASHAQAPEWFTTAPAKSIAKALERASLSADDIDLWEINEAFSVVALVTQDEVGIDAEKVNVNGGAVSLGHPIGCSGTRILVTLLHAMDARDAKRGCASICIGGGEAVAVIVER